MGRNDENVLLANKLHGWLGSLKICSNWRPPRETSRKAFSLSLHFKSLQFASNLELLSFQALLAESLEPATRT